MMDTVKEANSNLGESLKIGNRIAKNRFCIQPMEGGDATIDGLPSKYTVERYDKYAAGGAGIVVIEAVTLQYESRSTNHQLMLDLNSAVNKIRWERFFSTLKKKYPDTLFIMQLQHSGEISSNVHAKRVTVKEHPALGGTLVGDEYVDNVIRQTIEAAVFLSGIGCDGVDIKFCHGYLGSQILRPYNDRDWKYGGSWEKRSQFAYNMCEGIRKRVPSRKFLVGAKVSAFEGFEGGQILEESLALIKGLEERGADFIIESLGNTQFSWELMAPNRKCEENLYKHLAAAKIMRSVLKPETILIGGGLSLLGKKLPEVSEFAVSNQIFDMAALGRQAFADPYLPNKYLEGREKEINWCLCCDQCGNMLVSGKCSYCAVY